MSDHPPDSADAARDPCEQCGHPSDDHLLQGELPMPLEGWVTCPVAGCECYGTWSIDEASRPAMEQHRAELIRRQSAGEDPSPAT